LKKDDLWKKKDFQPGLQTLTKESFRRAKIKTRAEVLSREKKTRRTVKEISWASL